MSDGKLTMFGKTYNSVGSTDSNLVLKTKGDLKIQWGGKFIDLIKNGKIATEGADILKTAESSDEIKSDGIYLVELEELNEIWVCINGTKVNLTEETGDAYVSFLVEQLEVTADLKYTALINAGFYYKSLNEAIKSKVQSGLIFIVDENKLYTATSGKLLEYKISVDEEVKTVFDEITIGTLKIFKDESETMCITFPNKLSISGESGYLFLLNGNIYLTSNINLNLGYFILSDKASENSGFRLYESINGKTILEVDSLVWRNINSELPSTKPILNKELLYIENYATAIDPLSEFESEDIETLENSTTIECKLQYLNTYNVGDYIYIMLENSASLTVDYTNTLTDVAITASIDRILSLDITISIDYQSNNIESNLIVTIFSGTLSSSFIVPNSTDFSLENYEIIDGKELVNNSEYLHPYTPIEYKVVDVKDNNILIEVEASQHSSFINKCINALTSLSRTPLLKLSNNIELLDRSKLLESGEVDESIHSKIGIIKEEDFEDLKNCPDKLESVQVGIYSDNFIGLNSRLYDTTFKKRCDYPKYDNSITLPEDFDEDKYDNIVPNIEWIKLLLQLALPKGTITMFNGASELPKGWAICDGTKGTPNLVGKFIKAVKDKDEVGDNDTELNDNNELTLTLQHLPKHSHKHEPHTHKVEFEGLTGNTGSSGELDIPFKYSDYNWGLSTSTLTVVTSVTGEGVITETSLVNEVSDYKTLGGSVVGGNHTHPISMTLDEPLTTSSTTSIEKTLVDDDWPNKAIKIEPRSYSLIFIMKL